MKINNKEIAKNEKGLLIPKTDVVFQALFGVKGSERILGGFLSKILNQEVKKVSLDANQNLVQETVDEKLGILDLRAIIEENIDVNIEIQLVDKANLEKRILLYWARRYGVQLKPGEDYRRLRKTIAILITDYEIPNLVWFKDAHTRWELLERRNPEIKKRKRRHHPGALLRAPRSTGRSRLYRRLLLPQQNRSQRKRKNHCILRSRIHGRKRQDLKPGQNRTHARNGRRLPHGTHGNRRKNPKSKRRIR